MFFRLVSCVTASSGDWHFNQDGTLCYVLHKEWREFLSCPEIRASAEEIEIAAYFCLRNLRYLLVRQLVGYRSGLKSWPPEWAQWSHGIQGLNEYHQETREKTSLARGIAANAPIRA